LTEHISAKEYDINNGKETCKSTGLPYTPVKFGELGPEKAENGWLVFAHPLNVCIGGTVSLRRHGAFADKTVIHA